MMGVYSGVYERRERGRKDGGRGMGGGISLRVGLMVVRGKSGKSGKQGGCTELVFHR